MSTPRIRNNDPGQARWQHYRRRVLFDLSDGPKPRRYLQKRLRRFGNFADMQRLFGELQREGLITVELQYVVSAGRPTTLFGITKEGKKELR